MFALPFKDWICFSKKIICGFVILISSTLTWGNEEGAAKPQLREWRQYSVPYGEAEGTPRPPDSEFLKLLPPLRDVPQFDKESYDRGFAIWWRDYSIHIFSEQPPTQQELARRPIVQTIAGEDEPQILGIWGIRDMGKVTINIKSPFSIIVRRVEFNPRKVPGDCFGDSVEGGRTIGFADYLPVDNTGDIVKGQNSVFWLTVETPANAKPGKYQADLQIITNDKQIVETSLTIEVMDYTLPAADIAYGMYFRPISDELLPSQYRTPEMLRTYWRDMAKHGMTSATIYPSSELYDANGNVKLNGNSDIETLKEMMKEGLVHREIPIMWIGGWTRIPEQAAPVIAAEVKRLGLPELLAYGPDEPEVGNKAAKASLESLQPLRKHFRIVTAISDLPAEVYADYMDVFAVSSGRITPHLAYHLADKKAELWTYECNNKGTGNATWSRFQAGLYTWALHLKGNFLWCYTETYSWDNRKNALFCHVLPSDTGPIPSIQWETRREGIEDYRTLRLLESLISANLNNEKALENKKAAEARSWLNSIRDKVDWFVARNMPPSMLFWDGIELYPLCPNFKPEELSAVRAKAAAYIMELKSLPMNENRPQEQIKTKSGLPDGS